MHGFELNNRMRIEIITADYRVVRGFTLAAVILVECAFLGYDAESKVKTDTELVTAGTWGSWRNVAGRHNAIQSARLDA
jgi:hypothetical protein